MHDRRRVRVRDVSATREKTRRPADRRPAPDQRRRWRFRHLPAPRLQNGQRFSSWVQACRGCRSRNRMAVGDVLRIEILPPRIARHLLALLGDRASAEGREDRSRHDGADLDAVLRDLAGEPLHQPHQSELRRAVGAELGIALLPRAGGDRHDRAAPVPAQMRDRRLGAEKRTGQVGGEGLPPNRRAGRTRLARSARRQRRGSRRRSPPTRPRPGRRPPPPPLRR